ncbi:fasciclin domain-containing protein [Mucilaginibacter sp. AW1-3]
MRNFTQLILKSRWLLIIAICGALLAGLPGCKKMQYPLVSLNQTLNITSYLEANPSQFSLFDQILQRTGYAGFLDAYGSYTVFAPTNDAVNLYLKSRGKTSVNDINVDTLKNLVGFHVILGDTITSQYFIDGKLRTPTLQGQFLTSSVINDANVSSYTINKQAKVLQTNIILGNGIMHVIDHVLSPSTQTLAQLIDANPKYKIFSAALKATGFYDTLNVVAVVRPPYPPHNYFTVFAQTDSVYNTMGITTVAQLQAKYSNTNNPLRNPTDGFYLYMSYHIMPENSYLTDILSKPSHATLSPNQDVITDVLQVQNIQLDYDFINGVQYPGVSVDRVNSNIPSTNGVLHRILGDLYIKVFPPTRVDWDLADQPEFRKLTSVFRRAGQSSNALTSPMQNMSWNKSCRWGYLYL